ncbi:MAG TPA: peptidylprolyl isomerase [Bacteroidales bacterium]|jgi:cyclophilin family peptidyl-prolyl cis-trans isomerase|nr:peptidylprolyl isomerase [Bacteroidota bacterium]HJN05421.1 peptidylprolyl isomerase [Bacteroidales bacterium]|tara:strand:+ start:103 stop:645 length:543 start_codon:yes stop_codon:yes gene_type:complete
MKKIFFILGLILSIQLVGQTEKPETIAVIHTTLGDITVKLNNDTPLHRDNFIKLVNEGWYEDSPFHRVINNFMIQGGHNKDGKVDPGYTIKAEILPNHSHKKGVLAAARMGDQVNPERNSSGCQFYIVQNQRGTPHLDGGYTIFGEVIMGLDVVDKIAAVQTGRGDVPVETVTMKIEIED